MLHAHCRKEVHRIDDEYDGHQNTSRTMTSSRVVQLNTHKHPHLWSQICGFIMLYPLPIGSMYVCHEYGLPFTINKNPSHVSIYIYTIHTDLMGYESHGFWLNLRGIGSPWIGPIRRLWITFGKAGADVGGAWFTTRTERLLGMI